MGRFLGLYSASFFVHSVTLTLVPAQSELLFEGKQSGAPVIGRFKTFSASAQTDAITKQISSVDLVIDTTSITVGLDPIDRELKRAEWLHTAQFPRAEFHAKSVQQLDATHYKASGYLTIKGKVTSQVVTAQWITLGRHTTLSGVFTFKRQSFGIGENEWADTTLIASDIAIPFKLTFTAEHP